MHITPEQYAEISSQTETRNSQGILVLRRGQNMFSRLYRINPHIAAAITNTEFDPFYSDWKIPGFLTKLTKYIQ